MKKVIAGIFLFLVTTLAVLAYFLSIILREGTEYERLSVEYYLLTPGIIKELPFEGLEDANYYYSTADGNKPVVNAIEFTEKKPANVIANYLIANKFKLQTDGAYKNGPQIVYLEYTGDERAVAKITVLERLD